MGFVVDASALAYASLSTDTPASALRRRLRDDVVHAPHLVDAELGSVLRRHVMRGDMAAEHATTILQSAPDLIDHRYGLVGSIAVAAWELRDNVTFYDAMYVALAAGLNLPLLTADARLAGAPNLPCVIETM